MNGMMKIYFNIGTLRHNYLNADMRIETTKNEAQSLIQPARSYNSKMCGQPGEYIIAPPQFFLDVNGATVAKYGDKGKLYSWWVLETIVNYLGLSHSRLLRLNMYSWLSDRKVYIHD